MNIETLLAENIAALNRNSAALEAVLAAGGVPTNVVTMSPPTETPKPKAGRPAKAAPAPEPTPEPTQEPEIERPTKVAVSTPAEDEFSDPLDPETTVVPGTAPAKIDTDAMIADCVETFKTKMTAADPARKAALKDVDFPALREKYGLATGDKLITLAPTPEKLVALLADIKAL